MSRALSIFLFLSILGSSSPALAASPSFRDAFIAYSKMRRLEREQKLLPYSNLKEEEIAGAAQKLSSSLTQARIDFFAIARTDGKLLSPWEKQVLSRVTKQGPYPGKVTDEEGLDFLVSSFPQAKAFSLIDWEVVREWFGKKTEEAFLKTTFAARELPQPAPNTGKNTVLWIRTVSLEDPLRQKSGNKKDLLDLTQELARAGYVLEVLEITPFARADDQATELVQALSQRKSGEVILLSQCQAGSVIYRALDIYPGLRKKAEIKGWINLNGKLYGEAPEENRSPASVAADPVAVSAAEAKTESYRLYRENLERSPPLVNGFPIVNLLSLEGKDRPKNSLRESIVPEGTTWLAPAGRPQRALPAAFALVKDAASENGF